MSHVTVLTNGRAELPCVEHALQPGRDTLGCLVANVGRPAEAEQKEVLALDVGQHERASNPFEHVGRGRAAPDPARATCTRWR